MSYQVLARKWRPRRFEEVVGQGHVVRALANALDSDRVHHAFLFTGTRGVGKTTLARILAKCLNCETGVSARPCGVCAACRELDEGRFVDLLEVDAASRSKVDETRDLLENVPYAPTRGRYKVYLIDEVHMLSSHSFNALLKTLEEPPPHVKFLLATTDPQRLPVTVLSRCLQFNLKRIPAPRIAEHLARVAEAEGVPAEPGALRLLATAADGSVRDALSLLDQAIVFGAGALREAEVSEVLGGLDRGAVLGLLEAVAAGDGAELLRRTAALIEQTPDVEAVVADLAAWLHRIALLQVVGEVDEEATDDGRVRGLADRLAPEDVQLHYQIALLGRRDLPLAPDPRTALEMTLLRMLAFRPAEGAPEPAPRVQVVAPAPTVGVAGPAARPARAAGAADSAARPVPAAPARGRSPPPAPGPEPEGPPPGEAAWPEVVARLGLAGMARELAMNMVLDRREGDTLHLRLAPGQAQMRGKAREGQIERALAAYYGQPVRLLIEVGEAAGETPAARAQRRAAERQAEATRALEADPTVQQLRAVFDATVLHESVQPEDAEPDDDIR
jgi:DNA polymerase-3 subunit gamma/tau